MHSGTHALRLVCVSGFIDQKLPPVWYSKTSRWLRDRMWLWGLLFYFFIFFIWPHLYREPMDPGSDIMIEVSNEE